MILWRRRIWNNTATFSRCGGNSSSDIRVCVREITLSITIILLLTIEILQLISLGPYTSLSSLLRYFNFENMIQLAVIILAAACLGTHHHEQHIKWCSALGIVLAYLGNIKTIPSIS